MKKIFASIAVFLFVLALSVTASAQLTATSKPVVLKAIVPEYIGLTPLNTAPVVFNFKNLDKAARDRFSRGEDMGNFSASNAPSWEMVYNLKHRTVSVCAYASKLVNGEELDEIPAVMILGVPLQFTGGNGRWFGAGEGICQAGVGSGAVLMDQITGATSSYTADQPNGVRLEGFSLMQIAGDYTKNWQGMHKVPAPGVYLGTMYIVAQAI